MSTLKKAIEHIDIFYGPPLSVISDCLRGFLCAKPNHKLIACDFTAIEARVLAWLAGQESVLEIFRSHGLIYEHTASEIYGVSINDVTKEQRLIGKVATLALGFQGGVGAFQSMAKNYFIKISDSHADSIKLQWRANNKKIVQYWYDLEATAISAVQYSGQKFSTGPKDRRVIYLQNGSFLFCRLPSGRAICYPYPEMKDVITPWGQPKNALTYMGEDSLTRKFKRQVAYGGLLCENITQATARDLLVEAMHRFEDNNYPIVMHIHDEIVSEVPSNFGSVNEVEKLMCVLPSWAKDLPISAKGWAGERYRK